MNTISELLTIDHPAFKLNTVLVTEPIKELYQITRHILLVRESSCCFTGQSGVGKTRALILLEHMLHERMPELVVIRHNSWNQQVPSIRAFFKHFLTAVGHPELRGETFDLRHRLVCRLIDLARTYQSPFVVLLIDEANAMKLEDFLFLKDIYNDLDDENVQLVTIMMGQDPDFSDVIAMLREKGRSDLISRFARRRQSFRPFSKIDDVAGIFKQYDTAIWPADSPKIVPKFIRSLFLMIPITLATGGGEMQMENFTVITIRMMERRIILELLHQDILTFLLMSDLDWVIKC